LLKNPTLLAKHACLRLLFLILGACYEVRAAKNKSLRRLRRLRRPHF